MLLPLYGKFNITLTGTCKRAPNTVRGKKEFNGFHCNTGTDPVASKLFIIDDFNVLLWQLTSGIQQLITTKLAR